jgi:hypothetical protein
MTVPSLPGIVQLGSPQLGRISCPAGAD